MPGFLTITDAVFKLVAICLRGDLTVRSSQITLGRFVLFVIRNVIGVHWPKPKSAILAGEVFNQLLELPRADVGQFFTHVLTLNKHFLKCTIG